MVLGGQSRIIGELAFINPEVQSHASDGVWASLNLDFMECSRIRKERKTQGMSPEERNAPARGVFLNVPSLGIDADVAALKEHTSGKSSEYFSKKKVANFLLA